MGGFCLGLGEINHQEGERPYERWAGPEEGVDGAPQTEETLSIVTKNGRGALLCVWVWPEPGDCLNVTAGDRGRWQGIRCEGPPLPLI